MDGSNPNTFKADRTEVVQVPIRELEAEITELAGHMNAANHRWLVLIAEFDKRNGWTGCQSCAHWLNWKCGIAFGAAREKVRTAHALQELPLISAAMAKGELSYSKVRELTRVACPATEESLLMIARNGTAHHVETLVRRFRRAKEAEEVSRELQQRLNRFVSFHYEEDGSLNLKARLPAEAAAVVLKALDMALEELPREDMPDDEVNMNVPAGTPTAKPMPRMRRADALTLMAESFLQHGAEEMNGGDKYQIVVHVSSDHLTTSRPNDLAGCELEDGPAIANETAKRIACDCSVVRLTENEEGEPLNVGRKTRTIHPALRRALNSRDRGCRFPGCCNKRYIDHHHIEHWANGGETKPSNLVSLCRFHHHLVHEGGWHIVKLNDGALQFRTPDGCPIGVPKHSDTDWTQLRFHNVKSDVQVDPKTAVTGWRGERMDYDFGIRILSQRAKAARDVLAVTMHC